MNQKNIVLVLSLIFLVFIAWKSCIQHKTKLTVINNSDVSIDSIIFYLNNYKHKSGAAPPFTKKTEMVYPDSIQLNRRDVIIRAELYLKDSLYREAAFYNDLSSGLQKGYTVTLKKDSTTEMTVEW